MGSEFNLLGGVIVAKAKKPVDPNKAFLAFIKRYFTSISARRTPYAFFNFTSDPYVVALSNSDSELFHTYHAGNLSFHYLEFKQLDHEAEYPDKQYLDKLKEVLLIKDGVPTVRHLPNWMSAVNKYTLNELVLHPDPANNDWLVAGTADLDITEPYEKRQIVGYDLVDHMVLERVQSFYQYAKELWAKSDNILTSSLVDDTTASGCIFFDAVDISQVRYNDELAYTHTKPIIHIRFDGQSCPCLKEFVAKTKDLYLYERKFWFETRDYVRHMVKFEDDHVCCMTLRPNSGIYILYTDSVESKE